MRQHFATKMQSSLISKPCQKMQFGLKTTFNKEQFWLLIELSPIHSEKIILALHDHLVLGESRKVVCEFYSINSGYFSASIAKFMRIHQLCAQLSLYYIDDAEQ